LPNNCSERVEELAKPKQATRVDDVTQLTDFRGLVHCDNQSALEARFPGKGHELSKVFRADTTESAKPGWPPPPRPKTPQGLGKQVKAEDQKKVDLKRGSVPASSQKLGVALSRASDAHLIAFARAQVEDNEAPPPPEQRKSIAYEKLVNDPLFMSEHASMDSFSNTSPTASISPVKTKQRDDRPPPIRSYVYPVIVPVSAKKKDKTGARLGGHMEVTSQGAASTASAEDVPVIAAPQSARLGASAKKKSHMRYDVKIARLAVTITSATNLRASDRSGNSDPFCICKIPGRPRSKYQTRVVNATLKPVWKEFYEIEDFFAGDQLEFAVYDKDVFGNTLLGKTTLTQSMILPDGVNGDLELYDEAQPDGNPMLRVRVEVVDNLDPDGRLEAKAQRGAEESDEEPSPRHDVCRALDDFDAALLPVPKMGNFWMTPRGDMKTSFHDGNAQRRTMQRDAQQSGQLVVDATPTS
jgi:hypothetical protein